jgi:hypothetical protein
MSNYKKIFSKNKEEIFYNLINSALAGGLVFLGSLTTGEITLKGICLSFVAALAVALTKFKEYWEKEKDEYSNNKLKGGFFNFL